MDAKPEVTGKRTVMRHCTWAGVQRGVAESGLSAGTTDNALSGQHATAAVLDIARSAAHNVTANALRYSPPGSPPLLTASARGDRVELRVIDCGPGVPEHDWGPCTERYGPNKLLAAA
jgi:hypothetical protein